jgi:hypothetical protein
MLSCNAMITLTSYIDVWLHGLSRRCYNCSYLVNRIMLNTRCMVCDTFFILRYRLLSLF